MQDAGCPLFRDIVAYLFCTVLSVAMILYLVPWLVWGTPEVWVFFIAFCAVILYCFVKLGRGLFPRRWRRCSGSALVRRMVEIEGQV